MDFDVHLHSFYVYYYPFKAKYANLMHTNDGTAW